MSWIPIHALRYSPASVDFARDLTDAPNHIMIPTRHGQIGALHYRPRRTNNDKHASPAPVHLIAHGGAFVIRMPEQEANVANYLAHELGCHVIVPDYRVAPESVFPAAEEDMFDAYLWIRANAHENGWDSNRISVGGASAGGKLALNVITQALDNSVTLPIAASVEYGCFDMSLPDSSRMSSARFPVISPRLFGLVRSTFFSGADLASGLASPARHTRLSEFPPTLVLSGGVDTLKSDSECLAEALSTKQVRVTYKEFTGIDHGFTHATPVNIAREALDAIRDHLRRAYEGN